MKISNGIIRGRIVSRLLRMETSSSVSFSALLSTRDTKSRSGIGEDRLYLGLRSTLLDENVSLSMVFENEVWWKLIKSIFFETMSICVILDFDVLWRLSDGSSKKKLVNRPLELVDRLEMAEIDWENKFSEFE